MPVTERHSETKEKHNGTMIVVTDHLSFCSSPLTPGGEQYCKAMFSSQEMQVLLHQGISCVATVDVQIHLV